VIEGEGYFDSENDQLKRAQDLVIYQDGDLVQINSSNTAVRFLLISGKPIGEPIAWRGPIVMNTNEELIEAFEEYRNGTFIKHKKPYIKPIQ
jgi:redox-sensitive bicupin YhaK (pirin superfamily)